MPRLRHPLLNLLTALSLLLCVGIVALWVKGYQWGGAFEVRVNGVAYQVAWPVGRVALAARPAAAPHPPLGYELIRHPPVDLDQSYTRRAAFPPPADYHAFAGFGWLHDGGMRSVFAPAWLLALAAALLPAWHLPREWRGRTTDRRRRRGQCLSCGYDLRATPDRCPECGLVT
jgi:hypothetical protein